MFATTRRGRGQRGLSVAFQDADERNSSRRRGSAHRDWRAVAMADARIPLAELGRRLTPVGAAFPGGNGKLAFQRGSSTPQIYVLDRGSLNPLTSEGANGQPTWSKDASKIAFTSSRGGQSKRRCSGFFS